MLDQQEGSTADFRDDHDYAAGTAFFLRTCDCGIWQHLWFGELVSDSVRNNGTAVAAHTQSWRFLYSSSLMFFRAQPDHSRIRNRFRCAADLLVE